MKKAVIRSSWMEGYGYRLDCQPYLGGALETKIILERLPLKKEPLSTVTKAIYHAGREARRWVESPEYGVPFLSSSAILKADLSDLPLISRRQVEEVPQLLIEKDYTLITRSGTIGRMAYARREMDGMACSEHVLRVVPDASRIPAGYLYAFLSSKFGVPLVVSGTYGSIIQSIEPHHIADLPVPRLGRAQEQRIHALVEEAAELRTKASIEFGRAIVDLERTAGLPDAAELAQASASPFLAVESSRLEGRLDTNFHRPWHYAALQPFRAGKIKGVALGTLADTIVEPLRFKRTEHSEEDYSIPFFGTGSLGDIDPQPLYRVTRFPGIDDYRVDERTVLIPRSGQIYGIIGTAFQPIGMVLRSAVTEYAIRVNCTTPELAGFIFLALRSDCCRRQLKGRAFGGAVPQLDVVNVTSVLVPHLPRREVTRLGEWACRIAEYRTTAILKENEGRSLVEASLESHAGAR
jgi:type I restriction enzyme, S subunit